MNKITLSLATILLLMCSTKVLASTVEKVDLEYDTNSEYNTQVSTEEQLKRASTLNKKYVGVINKDIREGILSPLEEVYYLTSEINKAFVGAGIFEEFGFVVKDGKFYGTTQEVRYCSFKEYQGLCSEHRDPKYKTDWYFQKLEGFPLLKEITWDGNLSYRFNKPTIEDLMPGHYILNEGLYSSDGTYFGPYNDVTVGFQQGVGEEGNNPYARYQFQLINISSGTGILPRFKEDYTFDF